ncbi:lipopolysaccharide biosynthesis protein [Sutcliffiella deserti]|uniref:lipopolysaccharide biosynthesis protein n=1 Tax=Sutcliffiella deserti TaxID=2875501 RepID=UPI001CBF584E|nr:oligosaccharide flippase family protein [Sutcliffiella deserti]
MLKGKLKKGSFAKNVAVLMSGTAISQGLLVAAAPILSRLYDPASFGIFTLFSSIVIILSVIATWRYELAIVLPKEDEDASNVLFVSMICVGLTTIVSIILVLLLGDMFSQAMGSPELKPWLWWLPVSIFASGVFQSLNYWYTRKQHFGRVASSKALRSVGTLGVQIPMGLLYATPLGLVIGYVVGHIVSFITLLAHFMKQYKEPVKQSISVENSKKVAKEYKDFPKFSAPQAFINSLSQNIPAFLLAFYFGPEVVGLYSLSHRLLNMPITLIGQSVKQVFLQKASHAFNHNENVYRILIKATAGLAVIGFIPSIIIAIWGKPFFAFTLGSEWYEAGGYAQWMILWLFVGFVNSPSFVVIQVYGYQKYLMYYEILLFIARTLTIVIGGLYYTALTSIALYSVAGAVFNLVLILGAIYLVRNRQHNRVEGGV